MSLIPSKIGINDLNPLVKRNKKPSFKQTSEPPEEAIKNDNNESELKLIIQLMISESETNITRFEIMLKFHIRRNQKSKNDIVEKILKIINDNDKIYYNYFLINYFIFIIFYYF